MTAISLWRMARRCRSARSCFDFETNLPDDNKDLKLDNFNDIDALVENVKDHVKLDTGVENFNGIKIFD